MLLEVTRAGGNDKKGVGGEGDVVDSDLDADRGDDALGAPVPHDEHVVVFLRGQREKSCEKMIQGGKGGGGT